MARTHTHPIAAIVATRNRPRLLRERSLASIAAQERPPDYVIVADDSDADMRTVNRDTVAGFAGAGAEIVYVENRRTPGASGAWNTALAEIHAREPSAFVAVLDDDDSWDAAYLRRCEEAAAARGLDMVAAGIVYHRSDSHAGFPLSLAGRLDADDFLVGNPHIQGSNLFVRLRKLLEAGGFDEALPSTTDRDVCIRLADLGTVEFGALSEYLVHHYADDSRPRLTAFGGEAKRLGLARFFRKYRWRMYESRRRAFLERSRDKFGVDAAAFSAHPDSPDSASGEDGEPASPAAPDSESPLRIIAGAISSPDAGKVAALMGEVHRKVANRAGVDLRLVILENGGRDADSRKKLRDAVALFSERGLQVELRTLERQRADADAGMFQADPSQLAGRKSIALSRTMLQRYLFDEAKPAPGAAVWILDDDVVLSGLARSPNGETVAAEVDYPAEMRRLQAAQVAVALGAVAGEPPLPALSCVRVQLVDLLHNLERFAALPPDAPYPSGGGGENMALRAERRDYYYDLSSAETDRLETPFWYEATDANASCEDAFAEMASRLSEIPGGAQVFRPVINADWGGSAPGLAASVNRGPNALVFDVNALRDFPNAVPNFDGDDARRGDMVWSVLNSLVGGREVVSAPGLVVRQVRKAAGGGAPDFATLIQDIRGHAVYSALRDLLRKKVEKRRRRGERTRGDALLRFDEDEIALAAALYEKHFRQRWLAFEMSFIRCVGVLSSLRRFCERGGAAWWLRSSEHSDSAERLREFVRSLGGIYSCARLDEYRRAAFVPHGETVADYFRNLGGAVARYRAGAPLPKRALARAAEKFVKAEFGAENLSLLGIGEEGVALTDGARVYKWFHYWKPRDGLGKIAFLKSLVGKWGGYDALPDIQEIRARGGEMAAAYPYEAGERYAGGRLADMLKLLRECRDAGVVCYNIHPDNLIAARGGLRLIDFGADIAPFSPGGFESMVRRAFLAYRFHFRSDLKRLMTDSLADDSMPELAGLSHFRAALDPPSSSAALFRALGDMAAARGARTAFDYGCGSGGFAAALEARGIETAAFDPDDSLADRQRERGAAVDFLNQDGLDRIIAEGRTFDVVTFSRVACAIAGDGDLDAALRNVRRLAADGGTVLVAICNPFHYQTELTAGHERKPPIGQGYDAVFSYTEREPSGEWRTEIHRPLAAYRKAFAKAGLRAEEIVELPATDCANLLPASDYIVFRLAPAAPAPSVSLMIKTCYMEWRIAERLVRHQVAQLEKSFAFAEKVIVVDASEGPFIRQYEDANPRAHGDAVRRLLEDGVADRAVYVPDDPRTMRGVYRKWFGAESENARSAGGQQLFATLYGLDACAGDCVLQMDGDIIFARTDDAHDPVGEMARVLQSDPDALFVPPSIRRGGRRDGGLERSFRNGESGADWRVEARICMFDRRRLNSVLPIANELADGAFQASWHRAFDRFIAGSGYKAYRGGDPRTAFIHIPNDWKADAETLFGIIESAERGHVPDIQTDRVDLAGAPEDWRGPKRGEPFVFVICGRNVAASKLKNCIESLLAQERGDWGAVIIDDASENGMGEYAELLTASVAGRVTLIRNRRRRGSLFNTRRAITEFCANPESVIITLDADDALIGRRALDRVASEYADGADATIGSMLRLDKEADYPADLGNPRSRGANVWQHLRTFRKHLFDALSEEDLKLDGEWVDLAADWAYMVPIAEMARSPRYIADKLYLYEPASAKTESERRARDAVIARVLAKRR